MVTAFIVCVIIIIVLWLIIYYSIKKYNTIYLGPNNVQVVVLEKTLFDVTISFIDNEPVKISLLDFVLNYHLY